MTPPHRDIEDEALRMAGRRSYDELQADHAILSAKVEELTAEIAELRKDIKDLVGAWQTAKGVTAFVSWLSKFLTGSGIIFGMVYAFLHWGPPK